MDDGEDPGDVFAIPDLWGASKLDIWLNESSFLFADISLQNIDEKLPDCIEQVLTEDGFFSLPDLSFGLQSDPATPSTSEDTDDGKIGVFDDSEAEIDIWRFEDEEPPRRATFFSWNAFEDDSFKEPQTCYISEAGPDVFDAALADETDPLLIDNTYAVIINPNVFAASLLSLGLGRSSVLFIWNEDESCFRSTIKSLRISGVSLQTTNGIVTLFLECGNTTRILQSFIDRTYSSGNKSPSWIALADATSILLRTLQSHMNMPKASLKSILQLYSMFEPAEVLLSTFSTILQNLESVQNDEAMVAQLFEEVQRLEQNSEPLRQILLELLSRVSKPFLDFSGQWLGLLHETGRPLDKNGDGKGFVKVGDRIWVDEQGIEMSERDFLLDLSMVPSFFPHEDAQIMFETGRSLRFLRSHHSSHPLGKVDLITSVNPPSLEWNFSFESIERVEAKARKYEKDLEIAIKQYSSASSADNLPSSAAEVESYNLSTVGKSEEQMEAHILTPIPTLGNPFGTATATDKLSTLLHNNLSGTFMQPQDEQTIFSPPLSLAAFLSFNPIIAAQARVVNSTVMRLFFQSHNLREHLSVQWRFQLLGDGVFSSRLSHALFDPGLETAERVAGVARSGGVMGLRLGSRDTWPPASSELRLALMGVLTESYSSTIPGKRGYSGGYLDCKADLPGDISFAVREMSVAEIEACIDPHSLSALDFLRLTYKPPVPLSSVLTPLSLHKYDALFKLLLRVLRLLYVVSQLFRDNVSRSSSRNHFSATSQRFRIEAQHFLTCISTYFFSCIGATWAIFERKLDQVENRLNSGISLGQNEGIDKLREYHERVLDRIMFALLLRKRQQALMKLLEEIFTLILQFAKYSGTVMTEETFEEVEEQYKRFKRKIEVFIAVCKGMSEKKGFEEKLDEDLKGAAAGGIFDSGELAQENTIIQLLLLLEGSGYYESRSQVV